MVLDVVLDVVLGVVRDVVLDAGDELDGEVYDCLLDVDDQSDEIRCVDEVGQ